MAVKLLISAEANSGKTTLTKTLTDTLVISHDGKKFPFKVPHVTIRTFASTQELVNTINEKIVSYKERFGEYPRTIVFDSVSKIFDTMVDNCNDKFTGYKVYSTLNTEISQFTYYIENTLIASDMNVILISHAMYDSDSGRYHLIAKGDFAKRGAFLSEVDEAIFIEIKTNKRIIHFRSTKFPARSLQEELPDSVPIEKFNLNDHINTLSKSIDAVDEYEIQ